MRHRAGRGGAGGAVPLLLLLLAGLAAGGPRGAAGAGSVARGAAEAGAEPGGGRQRGKRRSVGGGGGALAPKLVFMIEPKEGPALGGTQVTVTIASTGNIPKNHQDWFCQFGQKVVPAVSYFKRPGAEDPEYGAILCLAPAGTPHNSVSVKISLDGLHFVSGPRYFYSSIGG